MSEPTQHESTHQNGGFSVGPGMHVSLSYQVRDAEGEPVGPELEQLSLVYGTGQLLPAVERVMDGLRVGDSRTLQLEPRDAYGPRNPDAVLEVDRSEFPEDVTPGDFFEVENADQGILVLRILEVGEDFVLVDMNHPLAGQTLAIELTVHQVRPATQDEMDQALAVGLEGAESGESSLISPDRLLRGSRKR